MGASWASWGLCPAFGHLADADSSKVFGASALLGIADERMYEFKRAHKQECQCVIKTAKVRPKGQGATSQ